MTKQIYASDDLKLTQVKDNHDNSSHLHLKSIGLPNEEISIDFDEIDTLIFALQQAKKWSKEND